MGLSTQKHTDQGGKYLERKQGISNLACLKENCNGTLLVKGSNSYRADCDMCHQVYFDYQILNMRIAEAFAKSKIRKQDMFEISFLDANNAQCA